jgi:hypothetical protein
MAGAEAGAVEAGIAALDIASKVSPYSTTGEGIT